MSSFAIPGLGPLAEPKFPPPEDFSNPHAAYMQTAVLQPTSADYFAAAAHHRNFPPTSTPFPTPPLAHYDQRRYAPGSHYAAPLPGGYPQPPPPAAVAAQPPALTHHYLEQYAAVGIPSTTPTTGEDSAGDEDDDPAASAGNKPVIFPWMKKVHNGYYLFNVRGRDISNL